MKPAFDVPTASTIFCDDYRREDNGKIILLGVYAGGMSFPTTPPVKLVGLALWSEYVEPAGYPMDAVRFTLSRLSDGMEIFAKDVFPAGSRPTVDVVEDIPDDTDERRLSMIISARLQELSFERPDRLRARWFVGDRMIHAGSIAVVFEPEDAPAGA